MKVKKVLILVLTILCANTIFAQTVDGVSYEVYDSQNLHVRVTGCSNDVSEITIPQTITISGTTYTVKTMASNAFSNKTNLSRVTILAGISEIKESVFSGCTSLTAVALPSTLTSIGGNAFQGCTSLTAVELPSTLTSIGSRAFQGCTSLTRIEIPEGITVISSYTFYQCSNLAEVELPSTLTNIGRSAFYACGSLTEIEIPALVCVIDVYAFRNCSSLARIVCHPTTPPALGSESFSGIPSNAVFIVPNCKYKAGYIDNGLVNVTTQWETMFRQNGETPPLYVLDCEYFVSEDNGDFNDSDVWGASPEVGKEYRIQAGHVVTIPANYSINIATGTVPQGDYRVSGIDNKGVLRLAYGGQLKISDNSGLGIVEVETNSLTANTWNLIGAPFATGYQLETIIPGAHDISVSMFDYNAVAWSNAWATIETPVYNLEAFFAWPFETENVAFTNYGDGMYSPNAGPDYDEYSYDFTQNPRYTINCNHDISAGKTQYFGNGGYWRPLANPYTFKLNIATFISNNNIDYLHQHIQGDCIYKLVYNQQNQPVWQPLSSGVLNVTEGFMVNFADNDSDITNTISTTAKFSKNQTYIPTSNKSSAQREFVKLAMVDRENEIEVLFAHNEEAEQEYDIFDANKLFSPVSVTEHYFVTDGRALVKEEVKSLPYYATMNVKSYKNKEVSFKLNNLPQGISVSIIDGEEVIDLTDGAVYTTNISAGENADRFKVLFNKSVGLSDVEEAVIDITNNNRNVSVMSTENNLQVEVYNALGQKVYETRNSNFTLGSVPAGAYIIKAFNKKVNKSAKIIVK